MTDKVKRGLGDNSKNNSDYISMYEKNAVKEMMTDIQLRDKHRGTCLTDVFPEWEPYYEKL